MYEAQIEDILHGSYSVKEKLKLIDELSKDFVKEVKIGYRYCSKCNNYYRDKSWDITSETKIESVCIYQDPINSGGNEYKDKEITRIYCVCPMGHKELI